MGKQKPPVRAVDPVHDEIMSKQGVCLDCAFSDDCRRLNFYKNLTLSPACFTSSVHHQRWLASRKPAPLPPPRKHKKQRISMPVLNKSSSGKLTS